MVPIVKARLQMNESVLGTVMLALGLGAMASMPIAGFLIQKIGSRTLMLLSSIFLMITVPFISTAPSPVLTGVALFLFGAFLGGIDIAMNSQAVAVENAGGKPVMAGFHAMYSVGGLLGAAIISVLLGFGIPVFLCGLSVSLILFVVMFSQKNNFLSRKYDAHQSDGGFTLRSPKLLLLGIFCFIVFLVEGAMLDWSAVLLKTGHHFTEATAGLAFACFSVAMAAGRFTGNYLNRVMGPRLILQSGSLLCAAGYLVLALIPHSRFFPSPIIGSILIGLGASNVVPVLFSAAGKIPGMPPGIAIASVATLGYTGLLVGPAFIGYAAHYTGLPAALCAVGILMLPIALFGHVAIKTKKP